MIIIDFLLVTALALGVLAIAGYIADNFFEEDAIILELTKYSTASQKAKKPQKDKCHV